ncbi:hypothetical protein VTO42DRAFT_4870 [Malbranchea cinnamomea]
MDDGDAAAAAMLRRGSNTNSPGWYELLRTSDYGLEGLMNTTRDNDAHTQPQHKARELVSSASRRLSVKVGYDRRSRQQSFFSPLATRRRCVGFGPTFARVAQRRGGTICPSQGVKNGRPTTNVRRCLCFDGDNGREETQTGRDRCRVGPGERQETAQPRREQNWLHVRQSSLTSHHRMSAGRRTPSLPHLHGRRPNNIQRISSVRKSTDQTRLARFNRDRQDTGPWNMLVFGVGEMAAGENWNDGH